ncbi:hypothetical protein [Cryobacterium tagatosivorans]|nr:hypothetical protein [Cryobacterium tagatosivorans]
MLRRTMVVDVKDPEVGMYVVLKELGRQDATRHHLSIVNHAVKRT